MPINCWTKRIFLKIPYVICEFAEHQGYAEAVKISKEKVVTSYKERRIRLNWQLWISKRNVSVIFPLILKKKEYYFNLNSKTGQVYIRAKLKSFSDIQGLRKGYLSGTLCYTVHVLDSNKKWRKTMYSKMG